MRQSDVQFLSLLNNVANECVLGNDASFLGSRCFDLLPQEEQIRLRNAINLVPTWSKNQKVVFDNLMNNFITPICKIISSYDTITTNGRNHYFKEISYLKRTALCIGASVILLRNFNF